MAWGMLFVLMPMLIQGQERKDLNELPKIKGGNTALLGGVIPDTSRMVQGKTEKIRIDGIPFELTVENWKASSEKGKPRYFVLQNYYWRRFKKHSIEKEYPQSFSIYRMPDGNILCFSYSANYGPGGLVQEIGGVGTYYDLDDDGYFESSFRGDYPKDLGDGRFSWPNLAAVYRIKKNLSEESGLVRGLARSILLELRALVDPNEKKKPKLGHILLDPMGWEVPEQGMVFKSVEYVNLPGLPYELIVDKMVPEEGKPPCFISMAADRILNREGFVRQYPELMEVYKTIGGQVVCRHIVYSGEKKSRGRVRWEGYYFDLNEGYSREETMLIVEKGMDPQADLLSMLRVKLDLSPEAQIIRSIVDDGVLTMKRLD